MSHEIDSFSSEGDFTLDGFFSRISEAFTDSASNVIRTTVPRFIDSQLTDRERDFLSQPLFIQRDGFVNQQFPLPSFLDFPTTNEGTFSGSGGVFLLVGVALAIVLLARAA